MRSTPQPVRKDALDYAKTLYPEGELPDPERLIEVAAEITEFWTTPSVIRIRVGLIHRRDGAGQPHEQEGEQMQLHDDEQVTYTIEALDAKGYEVQGEAFSATVDDASVITVTQDGATFTAVAGAPGSAIVTFTDGTLSATEAIDVVSAAATTIQVTAGDITKQA